MFGEPSMPAGATSSLTDGDRSLTSFSSRTFEFYSIQRGGTGRPRMYFVTVRFIPRVTIGNGGARCPCFRSNTNEFDRLTGQTFTSG